MKKMIRPIIFGEVLFDCFPDGEQILGGAPFNVAWHLQAFGDQPCFVSRVGSDELGNKIIAAMEEWGMDTSFVQIDPQHRSGRVDVQLIEDEPHYSIAPDCAYDFIDENEVCKPENKTILYHGTLGLRNAVARHAFEMLAANPKLSIFLDVNLRPPHWHKEDVSRWLQQATWVKLNYDELEQLGSVTGDIQHDMAQFQQRYQLEQLILTRGEKGAIVRTSKGELESIEPQQVQKIVDTVGAGDAFTAVYLHGLISGWCLTDTLKMAQKFASTVVGLRGATANDPAFYKTIGLSHV